MQNLFPFYSKTWKQMMTLVTKLNRLNMFVVLNDMTSQANLWEVGKPLWGHFWIVTRHGEFWNWKSALYFFFFFSLSFSFFHVISDNFFQLSFLIVSCSKARYSSLPWIPTSWQIQALKFSLWLLMWCADV